VKFTIAQANFFATFQAARRVSDVGRLLLLRPSLKIKEFAGAGKSSVWAGKFSDGGEEW
jgi:hypothetical protein